MRCERSVTGCARGCGFGSPGVGVLAPESELEPESGLIVRDRDGNTDADVEPDHGDGDGDGDEML